MKTVRRVAEDSALAYKNARLKSTQAHAFDQLTAMLGPFLLRKLGYEEDDWRAHDIPGLQCKTCAVVEAVVAWRRVRGEGDMTPFLWNNKNILLSLLVGVDFLGAIRELKHWYGPDYRFTGNPFCRATLPQERPSTPPSAMVTTIVDGVASEKVRGRVSLAFLVCACCVLCECLQYDWWLWVQVSEHLMVRRRQALAVVGVWQKRLDESPYWWPTIGDEGHQHRVWRCEKVLMEEVRFLSRIGHGGGSGRRDSVADAL